MKYVAYINDLIKKNVNRKNIVLYGQNISAGSCISGLTRGIQVKENSKIINTTNTELSSTGVGFGLMLNGVDSIFFMKQLDFLLLGMDHLVNTYNLIRSYNEEASFTIVAVIVDSGYEGSQSAFNNFSDMCSLANIEGYVVNNQYDAEYILNNNLVKKGFRIIAVSQRLFNEDLDKYKFITAQHKDITLYDTNGTDCSIVSFNLAFDYAHTLYNKLKERGVNPSLYSVNKACNANYSSLISDILKKKKLILIDDSKSTNLSLYKFIEEVRKEKKEMDIKIVKRELKNNWTCPNKDGMEIDYEKIIEEIISKVNYVV